MGFRTTMETHTSMCICEDNSRKGFWEEKMKIHPEYRQCNLLAWGPRLNKVKEWAKPQHLPLCFLTADKMWTRCQVGLPFPVLWTEPLNCCLCQGFQYRDEKTNSKHAAIPFMWLPLSWPNHLLSILPHLPKSSQVLWGFLSYASF